jgi:hypothetical protein
MSTPEPEDILAHSKAEIANLGAQAKALWQRTRNLLV